MLIAFLGQITRVFLQSGVLFFVTHLVATVVEGSCGGLGRLLEIWPESGGGRVSGYTWGQQV